MTILWVLAVGEVIVTAIWIFFLARGSYKAYQCDKEGMERRVFREAAQEAIKQDRERFVLPALQIVNEYLRKVKKIR